MVFNLLLQFYSSEAFIYQLLIYKDRCIYHLIDFFHQKNKFLIQILFFVLFNLYQFEINYLSIYPYLKLQIPLYDMPILLQMDFNIPFLCINAKCNESNQNTTCLINIFYQIINLHELKDVYQPLQLYGFFLGMEFFLNYILIIFIHLFLN